MTTTSNDRFSPPSTDKGEEGLIERALAGAEEAIEAFEDAHQTEFDAAMIVYLKQVRAALTATQDRIRELEVSLDSRTKSRNAAAGIIKDYHARIRELEAGREEMLAALMECQSALATVVEPTAIGRTTVINALAAARAAEAKARNLIAKAKDSSQ